MKQSPSQKITSGLYIVATPIGNMGDITHRALETLQKVNRIYCEDTRVSRRLLEAYDIKTPLSVYNDHSDNTVRKEMIESLEKGESLALVSDAGMPLVSDPGYKLVRAVQEAGITVTSVPGASSVLTALTLSGLPSDAFYFGGFIPSKEKSRREFLAKTATIPGTLVFFETANRLQKTLAVVADLYSEREVVVARELTKKFEEIRRDKPDKLLQLYQNNAAVLKGEIVLLIGPPDEKDKGSTLELDDLILAALDGNTLRDAVDHVMAQTGLKRKEVYNRAIDIKAKNKE